MIKARPITLAILLVGLALLCLQLRHRRQSASAQLATEKASVAENGAPNTHANKPAASQVPAAVEEPVLSGPTASSQHFTPPPPATMEPVADTAESTSLPAATILENMRTTIRQYGSTFGENPVGTNPEITAALQGDNPKHINFLKADGNRVNGKGELVDAWGTPYFFHQISGQEMEIRSAGPDRVMYTGDDLVAR